MNILFEQYWKELLRDYIIKANNQFQSNELE